MPTFAGSILKYPARAAFYWYLGLIVGGSSLLKLPMAVRSDRLPLSWIDALFTATSASCVTGLSVRSTREDFSMFGQVIILLLIQLGGIGIMTVTTFITLRFGRGESLRQRVVLAETLGSKLENDLNWVLRNVMFMILIVEGIGSAILSLHNVLIGMPVPEAIWEAVFHAVSAFCNAGFALYDDSLTRYQTDVVVNLTIISLIVIGGLGFPVLFDYLRTQRMSLPKRWSLFSIHTKMMLIGTAVLLVFGTLMFLLLEWETTLANRPLGDRLLIALFQSATTRTAGFNSVAIGDLTNATLFIFVLLMMIGGGPCSTAGGFKVSTFMVLVLHAKARILGAPQVRAFRRSIPGEIVGKAIAAAFLFAVVAVVALTLLLVIEQSDLPHSQADGFLDALFECVSALGTVGLSTGLTTALTFGGKLLMIVLMFIGRLGPISVFAAVSRSTRDSHVEYPQGEILVG